MAAPNRRTTALLLLVALLGAQLLCATPPAAARATLTATDWATAVEQLLPALQDLALSAAQEEGDGDGTAGGRKLLATTYELRTASRVNLLAADAFSMVYTGGNFARAIFALMQPMAVAGQTGTISVDATYMLNMSSLLAQFVATWGDLMSKGARLGADGILPI